MRLPVLLAVAGLALVAVSALALATQGGARAQTATAIEADNFYFCDASFQNGVCETTVTAGDTVIWEVEAGTHTVTQCDDSFSTCPTAGGFDSGNLNQGQSFSQAFDQAGTFFYRCNIHPQAMRGQITVLAAPQESPAAEETPAVPPASPEPAEEGVASTPAAAPASGGPPTGSSGSPLSWWLLLAAGGGLLLGLSATFGLRRR